MSRFGPPAGVYVFLTQEAEFNYPLDHSLSDRKSALDVAILHGSGIENEMSRSRPTAPALEKLVTGPMKPMGI